MKTENINIVTQSSLQRAFIAQENLEKAQMQIEACKKVKITVFFDKNTNEVSINISPPTDKGIKEIIMSPGDTFEFEHKFNVAITKTIEKDHIFPLTLDFKGEKYLLNKTKNDKLLLTK